VVQGFGAVGRNAARFLTDAGAVLVGAADSQGAIHDPEGLEVSALIRLKDEGRSVVDSPRGERLDRDAVVGLRCDVWIPAARPDVVDASNVDRLRARLVVQGANIPFTVEAERALHARNVLVVPDFIANAGGVICAAMELRGATETAALQAIEEKIRRNTRIVLETARARAIPPRQAAVEMAETRVRNAMGLRRYSLFSCAPGYL
jgi:glutamate dehydrogenase (NAD(P)+)